MGEGVAPPVRVHLRHSGRLTKPLEEDLEPFGLETYPHRLRRPAAQAAAHGSFEQAQAGIERATGIVIGKRQVEALVATATVDVDGFYASRKYAGCPDGDLLVLTADAKGIVMRPQALRKQTAAKATSAKLATRLSKGENAAASAWPRWWAVYHCTPVPRTRPT